MRLIQFAMLLRFIYRQTHYNLWHFGSDFDEFWCQIVDNLWVFGTEYYGFYLEITVVLAWPARWGGGAKLKYFFKVSQVFPPFFHHLALCANEGPHGSLHV